MGAAQEQKVVDGHSFPQIDKILLSARQSGQKGNLKEAQALYADAQRQSKNLNYVEGEARALTGLGVCQFSTFSYRRALRSFLSARELVAKVNNPFLAGSVSGNLASLYVDLNSLPEAADEIDRAIHFFRVANDKPAPQALLNAYLVEANILFHQGNSSEGRRSSERAIALAGKLKDSRSEAFAWTQFAELIVLEKYDGPRSLYEEADRYLKNAARIQALTHDEDSAFTTRMDQAYINLCLGQPELALATLDRAMAASSGAGLSPSYEAPHTKGLILAELGRTGEALRSLHNAVEDADAWRSAALPGEMSSTATVAQLHIVYSDYANYAAATALLRHDEALVRDSLVVMAGSRAADLREQVAVYLHQLDRLPPEYYSLLRQLNAAQANALVDPGRADELSTQQIRAQLSLIQDQVGLKLDEFSKDRERNLYRKSLRDIQQSLGADDLLLSFSLGKKMTDTSYMWATTGDSVNLYPLGSRQNIEAEPAQFKTAVRSGSDSTAAGCRLSNSLFSRLPPLLQSRKHWLLVPDGGLLDEVPWAALPEPGKGESALLISRRDVRTLPSEFFLGKNAHH